MAKFRFQNLMISEESINIADQLFDIADSLEQRKLYRFAEPYLSKINVKNKKEQFELKVKDKMNNKKIY